MAEPARPSHFVRDAVLDDLQAERPLPPDRDLGCAKPPHSSYL